MLEYLRQRLAKLLEERAAAKAELDAVLVAPEAEKRDLTKDEAGLFDAKRAEITAKDAEIDQVRARVAELEESAKRQAEVDKLHVEFGRTGEHRSPARVGAEPETYRKGGPNSYFRDLTFAQLMRSPDAIERLARNDREQRALTTTDGAIGEFVPPLWLVNEYVALARAGRVVADQLRQQALPPGTDSINLPKLSSGTAVKRKPSSCGTVKLQRSPCATGSSCHSTPQ